MSLPFATPAAEVELRSVTNVDVWIKQETGADDKEDDIAEISSTDCYITCTDPDTETTYTISADIKAIVYDDDLGDTTTSQWSITYSDSAHDESVTLYSFNTDGSYIDSKDHRRTAQARFFPWYEHESIFGGDLMKVFDAYTAVGLAPFFPLLFESTSAFSMNDDQNWINHRYYHKINYDPCPGKYIEIDACADDGGSPDCSSYSNTALAACYIYGSDDTSRDKDGDGIITIAAIDTEEDDIYDVI
jgi:hypothetical protein